MNIERFLAHAGERLAAVRPLQSRLGGRGMRLIACSVGAFMLSLSVQAADAKTLQGAAESRAEQLLREAVSYEHGEGVPRDQPRAASLYCEAARLGSSEAMYALGWMYANGRGLERNDAYANTLFTKAAALGHRHAERMKAYTGEYTGAAPSCLRRGESTLMTAMPVEAQVARLPAQRRAIAELLARLAPEYGIEPALALAIGLAESALDPLAVSAKNAMGVMQLIPETAERFRVSLPFDPEQNIRGGLAYLRWLLAYFEGDVAFVAAGYNAGEGAVNRYRGVPPYAETRAYVDRILQHVGERLHPYDGRIVAPSPIMRKLQLAATETAGR